MMNRIKTRKKVESFPSSINPIDGRAFFLKIEIAEPVYNRVTEIQDKTSDKIQNNIGEGIQDQPKASRLAVQEKSIEKTSTTSCLKLEKRKENIDIRNKIRKVRIFNKISLFGISVGIVGLWVGAVFIGTEQFIGKIFAYSGMLMFTLSAITGSVSDLLKKRIQKKRPGIKK